MPLTSTIRELWNEAKYQVGKSFRIVALPASLIAGGYGIACQPPRRPSSDGSGGGSGSFNNSLPTEFPVFG